MSTALERLQAETAELRTALENRGLFKHKRTAAEVEPMMTMLHINLPAVMAQWDTKQSVAVLLVRDETGGAAVCHFDLLPNDSAKDPLLFKMQDYLAAVTKETTEGEIKHDICPQDVALIGFFGECLRGVMSTKNHDAQYYLSEILRLFFPDKERVLMQLFVEGGFPPTLTVDGYFLDD